MRKIKGGLNLYQDKEPAFSRNQRRFLNPQVLYIPMSSEFDTKTSTAFLDDVIFLGQFDFEYPGVKDSTFGRFKLNLSEEDLEKTKDDTDEQESKPIIIKSAHIDRLIEIAKKSYIIDETDGQPLFVKLEKFKNSKPDVIVADAIDDEPLISSNINTFIKKSEKIVEMLNLVSESLEVKERFVVTHGDIDDAKSSIPKKVLNVEVKRIREKYPISKRKTMILRNMDVKGKIAYIGVQALLHLYRAVYFNKKQSTTIVTVTGDCIGYPCNVEVVIGSTLREVLEFCGLVKDPKRVFVGGTMTGITMNNLDLPVLHTTRAVVAFEREKGSKKLPCINCGRCSAICPSRLTPEYIYKYNKNNDLHHASKLSPEKCLECGACSYICPSRLELSHIIAELKSGIKKESGAN